MLVVLRLDGLDLLLVLLHFLAVLLHVALQLLVLLLEPGEVGVASLRLRLREEGLQLQSFGLGGDPGLGLLSRPVEAVTLALGDAQAVQLLLPRLGELLDDTLHLGDGLDQAVGANDVFQILEQAVLMLRQGLWLHQGDLLDLTLQDQEAVVLKVHASLAEQAVDLCEVAGLAVEIVLRLVVLEGLAGDGEQRALDDLVVLGPAAGVDDILEGDRHLGAPAIGQGARLVDQFGHLVQAHLLRALAENEEQGVDGVGLAASVRADDGGEALVEGADNLLAAVGLEVFEDDLPDHEPRLRGLHDLGRRDSRGWDLSDQLIGWRRLLGRRKHHSSRWCRCLCRHLVHNLLLCCIFFFLGLLILFLLLLVLIYRILCVLTRFALVGILGLGLLVGRRFRGLRRARSPGFLIRGLLLLLLLLGPLCSSGRPSRSPS
mmetsp:Transcript_75887/g.199864  ORF Transcript_75887/g.199864 Transcript_75887/m.199864 type:complete len:431 (+) Transcript_75887:2868-4160(+)